MNKIGFKNFRRFKDFPLTELGPITFLVGRNNSGKSTMVKALLLVSEYLKSGQLRDFSFTNSVLEDINIVTFERAKNKLAYPYDLMSFVLEVNDFTIGIYLSGREGKTSADVHTLMINDKKRGFIINIDPQTNSLDLEGYKIPNRQTETNDTILLDKLIDNQKKIKQELDKLSNEKSSYAYIEKNQKFLEIEENIKMLKRNINSNKKFKRAFKLSDSFVSSKGLIAAIEEFVESQLIKQRDIFEKIQQGKKGLNKDYESYQSFKEDSFHFLNRCRELENEFNKINFGYLGANPTKQSALFAIRDKNNSLAQAIHEYYQLDIEKRPGSDAYLFVRKWMQEEEFEIGEDLEIKIQAGEAYEVIIKSYEVKIPLADKGMGSIQAMLLIFRLACIIDKTSKNDGLITVIIEEPELNLHPALQSKLALMFHEVYIKHNIHFIIETHSEYLIRKTQVLVKKFNYDNELNPNPFHVIYFDKNMKQWKMNYREDGKFIEDFGRGFVDEASNLALDLF